jgi:competence protein ComEA
MNSARTSRGWITTIVLLAAVIVVVGIIIVTRLSGGRPVELKLAPETTQTGRIYVGGAVNDPGYYPLRSGDKLEDVLAAAGGLTAGAGLGDVRLVVVPAEAAGAPQRVDINRAGAWLLEALPGVGEARAQAIIAYRERHGPFRDTHELTRVPGFGEATFEDIQDLITVAGPGPD